MGKENFGIGEREVKFEFRWDMMLSPPNKEGFSKQIILQGSRFTTHVFTLDELISGTLRSFRYYKCLYKRQFTGLRDKNEKDVYEGDILITENGKPAVVEFYIGMRYGLRLRWHIGNWFISNTLYIGRCEVIGNIFENPELLK